MVTLEEDVNASGDVTTGGSGGAAPATNEALKVEVPDERKALVNDWVKKIKESKNDPKTAKAFTRMRKCMKIAADGSEELLPDDHYVVPVLNRLVNVAVAALYAKNPKAVAKRKEKMLFTLWDGDPMSLQAAAAAAAPPVDPAGQPMVDPMGQPVMGDPNAIAMLQEVMEAKQMMLQYDRMARTLELLFAYFLDEQDNGYKEQFKALVRRAKVCGVGYVKLGYQRLLEKNPDVEARIADATSQIAAIEAGLLKLQAGSPDMEAGSAKLEELKLLMEDLQSKLEIIVREGPVLSFPRSTEIIIDKKCRHLKTFAGARWIAHEFDMDPDEVLETYKVDIKGQFTAYSDGKESSDKNKGCAKVWEVQDKRNGQVFTVCDGYCDFLKPPAEPDVKIERFWTIFPLVYNEIEHEEEIYPPSDVWNARHMQREWNSARQGLREHRIAARPRPLAPAGRLENADLKNLSSQAPFEIIGVNALTAGEKIGDLVQWMPVPGVDPNLYEVESTFGDIQRSVGVQEANLGGTSGDTATEASIAENGRESSNGSDIDDLDTMLGALARAMGQLMLLELTKETVIEIAGPGAVWPDQPPTREQVVKDLLLDVEAGSSGRPNMAAEIAKFERLMPHVTLIPGMNPKVLAKKAVRLMEENPDDAIVEGLPSIVAMNQMMKSTPVGGDPNSDPNQQGDKGGQNEPKPAENEPQSQPAYPTPAVGTSFA